MTAALLETERLLLRPLSPEDAGDLIEFAGDFDVARMTSDIPHPLDRTKALAWLTPSRGETRFALVRESRMIGSAGYFKRAAQVAELGFWIGRPFWGQGLATEAGRAIVRHAFQEGDVERLTSSHFVDNPASGRVLAKLGFEANGRGRIWSSAREREVMAVLLDLTRSRAAEIIDPALARPSRPSRWSQLIERVRGA